MKKAFVPGKISIAVREGLALRAQLLADGVPEVEADHIVGQGLKAVWQQRDEPWHYYCLPCKDSGWRIVEPSYMERQRLIRLYGETPQNQNYLQACDPCPWRDLQRAKRTEREERYA